MHVGSRKRLAACYRLVSAADSLVRPQYAGPERLVVMVNMKNGCDTFDNHCTLLHVGAIFLLLSLQLPPLTSYFSPRSPSPSLSNLLFSLTNMLYPSPRFRKSYTSFLKIELCD